MELVMQIDHRIGILKADVSSVSRSSIFVYNSPTDAAPQFL